MNATSLHYNFIDPREIRSPSAIRARFIIPAFLILCLLSTLVMWQLTTMRIQAVESRQRMLEYNEKNRKGEFDSVIANRMKEQELKAQLAQIAIYRASRHTYGEALAELTNGVSDQIQMTELRISSPRYPEPVPLKGKKAPPVWGPTNAAETVNFTISGRVLAKQDNGTEAVGMLLQTLQSPAFSNLVRKADIPKGAFRQDTSRRDRREKGLGDVLLYEISCDCLPRRFE